MSKMGILRQPSYRDAANFTVLIDLPHSQPYHFSAMIGQSNRQTLPQPASECFQCFMLPQSANIASVCRKSMLIGYKLGYKSAAKTQSQAFNIGGNFGG